MRSNHSSSHPLRHFSYFYIYVVAIFASNDPYAVKTGKGHAVLLISEINHAPLDFRLGLKNISIVGGPESRPHFSLRMNTGHSW